MPALTLHGPAFLLCLCGHRPSHLNSCSGYLLLIIFFYLVSYSGEYLFPFYFFSCTIFFPPSTSKTQAEEALRLCCGCELVCTCLLHSHISPNTRASSSSTLTSVTVSFKHTTKSSFLINDLLTKESASFFGGSILVYVCLKFNYALWGDSLLMFYLPKRKGYNLLWFFLDLIWVLLMCLKATAVCPWLVPEWLLLVLFLSLFISFSHCPKRI